MTKALSAAILVFVTILAIGLLAGSGAAEFRPIAIVGAFRLSTPVIFLLGFALGAIWLRYLAIWFGGSLAGAVPMRELLDLTLIAGAVVAAVYLGIAASLEGAVPPLRAGILIAFVIAALLSGYRCLQALSQGEPIGFESHWGGFGGGGGGWRLLPATAMFFLTLTFVSAATAVALAKPTGQPAERGDKTARQGGASRDATANSAAPESTADNAAVADGNATGE